MLKRISPAQRMEELESHLNVLDLIVGAATFAGAFVLAGGPPGHTYVLFALFAASKLVSVIFWFFLTVWFGRVRVFDARLSAEADYERFVEAFSAAWWRHEFVLSVFTVAMRVTFCLWGFQLLMPFVKQWLG